jgi:urocanate hydratase
VSTDVQAVLDERGGRYGAFASHARASQALKELFRDYMGDAKWANLNCDQQEALEMIAHKIARILNGDPNYADSWVDIAGYAKLVADRLLEAQNG